MTEKCSPRPYQESRSDSRSVFLSATLRSGLRAFQSGAHFGQAASATRFSGLEAVQLPSGPATAALNLQRAAEADKVGSGLDMLRGHPSPLGR